MRRSGDDRACARTRRWARARRGTRRRVDDGDIARVSTRATSDTPIARRRDRRCACAYARCSASASRVIERVARARDAVRAMRCAPCARCARCARTRGDVLATTRATRARSPNACADVARELADASRAHIHARADVRARRATRAPTRSRALRETHGVHRSFHARARSGARRDERRVLRALPARDRRGARKSCG